MLENVKLLYTQYSQHQDFTIGVPEISVHSIITSTPNASLLKKGSIYFPKSWWC